MTLHVLDCLKMTRTKVDPLVQLCIERNSNSKATALFLLTAHKAELTGSHAAMSGTPSSDYLAQLYIELAPRVCPAASRVVQAVLALLQAHHAELTGRDSVLTTYLA